MNGSRLLDVLRHRGGHPACDFEAGQLTPLLKRCLALRDQPAAERPAPEPRRWSPLKLTQQQRSEIAEAYRAGSTMKKLANRYSIARSSLRTVLIQQGIKLGRQSWTQEHLQQVEALKAWGLSKMTMARELGLSDHAVWDMVALLEAAST